MKTLLHVLLLSALISPALSGPAPAKAIPLPFPTAPAEAVALSYEEILQLIDLFDLKIGGYPPRWAGPDDRAKTYVEWSRAHFALDQLAASEGHSERILVLQSRLYRQGHNMDVMECGQRADATIKEAVKQFPDSVPANFQASYFYLQINPKYAPEGEKALLRLRHLLNTDQNFEVEKGFVFAYIYQDKIEEAKMQIDRCLKLAPKSQQMLQLKEALRHNKVEHRTN